MTSHPTNPDELLELLGNAWDGRLDEISFARLEELLSSDPGAACDTLVAFSQLQMDLAWVAASSQAHEKALASLAPYFETAASAARSSSAVSRESVARRERSPRVRFKEKVGGYRLSWRGLMAIAAGIVVLLAAFAWRSSDSIPPVDAMANNGIRLLRAPHKVARVASVDGAVWQDGASYLPQDLLTQGKRLELLHGTAQVSMACGAEIVLQSPCTVELVAENRVWLEAGKLTSHVAPWGKGFVVETDSLRITDLGTRFGVSVDSPGIEEVHVLEGMVRAEVVGATMGTKPQPLLLKSGQAARMNQSQAILAPIQADSSRFASRVIPFRPLRPIDLANTGQGLSVGSRDPRWRIVGGHASGGPMPVQATVCRPHDYYLENAPNKSGSAREESRWISVIGGTTRGVAPYTAYTFETTFDLTRLDPSTVHLVGQILVDNRVQEIRLNGKPVDVQPWEGVHSRDFQEFHVVEIREGFKNGVNRVEIDVVNGVVPDGSYNPMALRVEWQAFGCVKGS